MFDELGVDHIFIDEAQYFKNLETPTKMDRVAGIQTGGSERAFDLYMKARYLHQQHPGHGVTFATGTPISNTMVRDVHACSASSTPKGLKSRGIDHFDAWAATFGEVVDTMEISPDGKTLKPRSRFARFVNLPELQQMFRAFADVQTAEMLNLPRPRLESGKPIVVACPMSEEQARHPAGAGGPLRPAAVAEGRSAGGQRPGHHHRRPQARPRCPDALGRRHRTSPARRSTPWWTTSLRDLAADDGDTRHADDLLRHGRASRRPGAIRPMTRSSGS